MNNPEAFADYLAEKPPFLKLPRHPFTRTGDTLSIPLGQASDFCCQDFTDLMLQTGTMGALNLALEQSAKTTDYIMMERLHIVRYGDWQPEARLHANIRSTFVSARKGKALAHILDEQQTLIYTMLTGYHVFSRTDFEQRFVAHRNEAQLSHAEEVVLPVTEVQLSGDPHSFRVLLGPFTAAHCEGHFPRYPCVPVSFIMRGLFSGIIRWLQKDPGQLLTDNVEIFTTRMIPVARALSAAARVIPTSRRSYKFIVTLEDTTEPTILYGHYIIDIREGL